MRQFPQVSGIATFLAVLALLSPAGALARDRHRERPEHTPAGLAEDLYRADALAAVGGAAPEEVQILTARGSPAWPAGVRESLERRIRHEWNGRAIYGPVHTSLGMWLRWPLVTAEVSGRVLVPVVDGADLPITGALELPDAQGPRRVIILVDASASANALTPFRGPDGSVERIPVLEAERRALDHLVGLLDDDWLEFGVIAFGESTWPIAEPGVSRATLEQRLAEFRSAHPRGAGRTDAVCALWTAVDWLDDAPSGVEREIVLLTDGDLPHSGRFVECNKRRLSDEAWASCEARRNQTTCPATRKFGRADGRSDLVQMASFGRRMRRKIEVNPLLFEPDRAARAYEQLARRTGGRVVRVPSPQAIEVALPALVSSRIRGAFARNETTGQKTPDLLQSDRRSLAGALHLAPGANDIELRVTSDRGVAGLFRFRVYSQPGHLEHYLAGLRERNLELERRSQELRMELRDLRPPRRSLDLQTGDNDGDGDGDGDGDNPGTGDGASNAAEVPAALEPDL